ncbi:competence type IV pilus minor pilin ComGG [Fervidibacillus albus]|uniref:Competence type IV pilus minor pilin ComGG n=1 Tax=Fervidibacillus albus TaxID=2980026 RepID=A0A9E8LWK9_9BACI|nr:competence type IV pilus minor pilin ComGG [Fervidibacillus albus]WAA10436.1 competence type IV pilus minor pilin ComGG [Fervidibacillus albus]
MLTKPSFSSPLTFPWKADHHKGLILPFTLFLLLIISLMTVHAIAKFEVEKRFFKTTKTTYELETLLVMAVDRLNEQIEKNDLPDKGTFQLDIGFVQFETIEESDAEIRYEIQCFTEDGGECTVRITYDKTTRKMIDWTEV